MSVERADLARFERLVAEALLSADPAASFARAADDAALPDELRSALRAADGLGVRMSALLIARLRFERLVRGSRVAGEWFERDPRGFADAFRRYHESTPPTAQGPRAEGRLFDAFVASDQSSAAT